MKISMIAGKSGNELRADWTKKETEQEFSRTESGNEFAAYAIGTLHKDVQPPKTTIQFIGVWEVYRRVVYPGQGFSVFLRSVQPSGSVCR